MSVARSLSDADRITAEGIPITLKGEKHRLRFGIRAAMYIESEFGGIDEFVAELSKNKATAICGGIVAALFHEKPSEMAVELFQEKIIDLLDGASLAYLSREVAKAIVEALPPRKPGDTAPKGKGSRGRSRGAGTTSWPPSATAARTRSSLK